MNKDMKLSEHFTLGELTKTSYKTEDQRTFAISVKTGSKICGIPIIPFIRVRLLSLPRSTEGRLLPARLCRLACPRTGRKKHRYL